MAEQETKPGDPQLHWVQLKTPAGFVRKEVLASTGDEAAAKALAENPGAFVAHVEPAPKKRAA
jgi:hypothetical protein